MRLGKLAAAIMIFVSLASLAEAKVAIDFGYRGNTQDIAEESLKSRFLAVVRDINTTKMKMQAADSTKGLWITKAPLVRCEENRTREFEPGITLKKDHFAPNGKLLARAGQKINPLASALMDYIKKPIVLLDATSERQIDFTRKACKDSNCIIFVARGNSLEASKLLGMEAYPFPETIAKTLDSQCSLSIYTQRGDRFRIREISFEEKTNAQ